MADLVKATPPFRIETNVDANGQTTVDVYVQPTEVPPDPPDPPDPTGKPVLAITSQGGNVTNTQDVTVSGTIDLPNVALDIQVTSVVNPTDFGTCKANAQGQWNKVIRMTDVGNWKIWAHASNSAGTTDSNQISFVVSGGSQPPNGGGGGTDAPPNPSVTLNPGASRQQIQDAINACPAGQSVVFNAGNYNFGGTIRLKANVCAWADGAVNVSGAPGAGSAGAFDGSNLSGWTVSGKSPGQGFVLNASLINCSGATGWVIGNTTFNNVASNGYDGSAVRIGSCKQGTLVNCDFNNCQGNVVGMYNFSDITFDGNHFNSCKEPFAIHSPAGQSGTWGKNLWWFRNVFLKTQRVPIELGPNSSGKEWYDNIRVENNFFDDFNNTDTSGLTTLIPISLVGQLSQNTTVKDNYCRRGNGPNQAGKSCVGIEFTGTGKCYNNTVVDMAWAGFMYTSGWDIYGNPYYVTPGQPKWSSRPDGWTNNGGGTGNVHDNPTPSSAPATPPQPTRVATSTYYSWSK